jgi:hypothetical protein
MDRLQAIVWFNENKERDWRAAPTPEIAAAFSPGAVGGTTHAAAATGSAKPKLRLTLNRVRAGRDAVVRWRASRAPTVKRWRTYLDGRLVRDASATARRVARKRIARAGRYRWTVVGRNLSGRRVVSETRSFRVGR